MQDSEDQSALDRRIAAVRAFNRFYTTRVGAIRDGYLQSHFSLTEARVLYELAQTKGITASRIAESLDLDPGYLSRMLRRFEQDGLLTRYTEGDKRRSHLALTEAGLAAVHPLDERSRHDVGTMLSALPEPGQEAVVRAMHKISALLSGREEGGWTIRHPAPGDMGWVVERHGALYAQEYGFNHKFEAFVAQVAAAFLLEHDPARERGWIAERDGDRAGSVFLMRQSEEVAKLRLLLIEPSARGHGLGKRLVHECMAFARAAGYRRITLWTNDILIAARGIYKAAGFELVTSKPHSDFGPAMNGEEWECVL
jgi:DNA-binding MarR family transcriptional regulator/GNAT superfamily N-acetyltransferase